MPNVILFCEDSFHEKFIGALLKRFNQDYKIDVTRRFFSARGGLPRMQTELKEFLRDFSKGRQSMPDQLIVVVDANCKGYNERKRMMEEVVSHHPDFERIVTYAIPDPHIERWMLVDSKAFQTVFQRGCTLPAIKCKKDEYKKILRKEIRDSGIDAPLGGQEYAEEIVLAMDLYVAEKQEASLEKFLKSMKALYNGWSQQMPQ